MGFGLPEGNRGAGGVEEDAEVAHVWDFGDVLHDLGAEGLGLGGGGGNIIDGYVDEPGGRCSWDGVLHHAAARAFAGLDDGVGASSAVDVFICPGEEA